MHLITAWISPAWSGITPERIRAAIEEQAVEPVAVAHIYLHARQGWWLIGIFLDGLPPHQNSPTGAESEVVTVVKRALASLLPDGDPVIKVKLAPPALDVDDLSKIGFDFG